MNAVDTNVLVYAVDSAEPAKSKIALDLLTSLASQELPLVVPWQVAAEFLTCLRRWETAGKIGRQETQAYLSRFVLQLPIVYPTANSLAIALDLCDKHSLSHWDSMLIAACIEAGIETLYSEDFSHDVLYGSVRVLNPFK
jgi:predicted nucleic acid-binding protein